jgi:hypothetical protein
VSTLVAALVAEGATYLSDDATPLDLRSGRVRPFPQPVLLDDRSLDLLPEITPLRSAVDAASGRRVVTMGPACAGREPGPREVAIVLFPERDDSGVTLLHPIGHDDAIVRLAEQSCNFPGHEREALEAIHWLVRGADAYEVAGGNPRTTARAILDTLERARRGRAMCPNPGMTPV